MEKGPIDDFERMYKGFLVESQELKIMHRPFIFLVRLQKIIIIETKANTIVNSIIPDFNFHM